MSARGETSLAGKCCVIVWICFIETADPDSGGAEGLLAWLGPSGRAGGNGGTVAVAVTWGCCQGCACAVAPRLSPGQAVPQLRNTWGGVPRPGGAWLAVISDQVLQAGGLFTCCSPAGCPQVVIRGGFFIVSAAVER